MSAAQQQRITIHQPGKPDQKIDLAHGASVSFSVGDQVMYRSDLADLLAHVGSTRDGNQYDRITGARRTPLDVAAGDLAYRYRDDDTFADAAFPYNGTVEVIDEETKEHHRSKVNYSQIEPVDYFLRHKTGEHERCDKDGNLDPTLETRKVDNSGVNDSGQYTGGGTGGSSGGGTAAGQFVDHGGAPLGWPVSPGPGLQAQARGETHGVVGGATATYAFTVPADAKLGEGRLRFDGATKSAGNPVDVMASVNGVDVLHSDAAQSGGAPSFTYTVYEGEPSTTNVLNFKRGDSVLFKLVPTGDANVANDLIVDHQAPN